MPDLPTAFKKEVNAYAASLGSRCSVDDSYPCLLCPFRSFKRKAHLVAHMKYHKVPYFTAAAASVKTRSLSQFEVARALFRQQTLASHTIGRACPHNFLAASAAQIRVWNATADDGEKALLAKSNQVPLVHVWTQAGPVLKLKSQTQGCVRLNEKTYYSRDFEDLLVATALQCRGQLSTMADCLYQRWAESALSVPLLFEANSQSFRDCVLHILTNTNSKAQVALRDLKARATARGEWVSVSHDATFKCTFSVLGQKKMSQRDGEAHTAHTFLGITGACPGFSLQAKEGPDSFARAVSHRFTEQMAAQVRFFFSDCPNEQYLRQFPNAIGVAEDFVHLAIRLEYCSGGKRTRLSAAILALQCKFRVAAAVPDGASAVDLLYHGERDSQASLWDDAEAADAIPDDDFQQYLRKPFQSCEEYVAQLKRVAAKFPAELERKNSQGQAVQQILRNAATHKHYGYLQNGALFVVIAGGQDVNPGTTRNEAEHRTLKRWMCCVYQQHVDRLAAVGELHGLYRMLANAYKEKLAEGEKHVKRLRERRVVALVSGLVAAGGLQATAPQGDAPAQLPPPRSRAALRMARVAVDDGIAAATSNGRAKRAAAWLKHKASRRTPSLGAQCARLKRRRTLVSSSSLRTTIESSLGQA